MWALGDSNQVNPDKLFLSDSFTTITLPAGYDKFAYLGAVRNDSSSDLIGSVQRGAETVWVRGGANADQTILSNFALGGNYRPTNVVDFQDFMPPASNRIHVFHHTDNGGSDSLRYTNALLIATEVVPFVELNFDGSSQNSILEVLDGTGTVDDPIGSKIASFYYTGAGTDTTDMFAVGWTDSKLLGG